MAIIDLNDNFVIAKPKPSKGWHIIKVDNFEVKTSKAGNPYIDIHFSISDKSAPFDGYQAKYNNFVLTEKGIGNFVELLRAFNPDYKTNPNFRKFDPENQKDLKYAFGNKIAEAYFDSVKSVDANGKEWDNMKPMAYRPAQMKIQEGATLPPEMDGEQGIDDSDIPF